MRTHDSLDIDLNSDAHKLNPYPNYTMLLESGHPYRDRSTETWYVSRYEDVSRLLKDQRLRARGIPYDLNKLDTAERALIEPVERFYSKWMAFDDTKEHLLLREALLPIFSRRAIEKVHAQMQEWTDSCINNFVHSGSDLVEHVARPLAIKCMQYVLGIDDANVEAFVGLSHDLIEYLITPYSDIEAAPDAQNAIENLRTAVASALLPNRVSPLCQRLGDLYDSRELNEITMLATIAQFLTGTIEPITTSLVVVFQYITMDTDAIDAMDEERLNSRAITEEALRFEAPFHFAPRRAQTGFKYRNMNVERNDRVVLLLAAANRDPRRWNMPNMFDPFRAAVPHISFGRGTHACLGSLFARLQVTTAIDIAHKTGLLKRVDVSVQRMPSLGASRFSRAPVRTKSFAEQPGAG